MDTSLSELITLLCSELGKAALDAQRGQLVQISDFVHSLEASDEDFAARHVAPSDVAGYSLRKWGFDLFDERTPLEQHYDRLIAADRALAGPAPSGKIARSRKERLVSTMREQTMAHLIDQRRALLRSVVERDEMPRIHVDSGELSLRLNLSVAEGRCGTRPETAGLLSAGNMRATAQPQVASPKEQDLRFRTNGLEVVASVVAGDATPSGNEACLTLRFKTL